MKKTTEEQMACTDFERCEHNPRYTPGYREEIPDPTPVAVPTGFQAPESLEDMMRRLIVNQTAVAQTLGVETESEANDFEVDDAETLDAVTNLQVLTLVEDDVRNSKILEQPKGGDVNGSSNSGAGSAGSGNAAENGKGGSGGAEGANIPK